MALGIPTLHACGSAPRAEEFLRQLQMLFQSARNPHNIVGMTIRTLGLHDAIGSDFPPVSEPLEWESTLTWLCRANGTSDHCWHVRNSGMSCGAALVCTPASVRTMSLRALAFCGKGCCARQVDKLLQPRARRETCRGLRNIQLHLWWDRPTCLEPWSAASSSVCESYHTFAEARQTLQGWP